MASWASPRAPISSLNRTTCSRRAIRRRSTSARTAFTLRVKAADTTLPDGTLSGVLRMGDGRSYAVALDRAALAPGVHGLGAAPAEKADTSFGGIALAVLFAFIGGLILNLMPCVFPVLSMKLLSLSRAGHDARVAQTESLVYGGGAVLSFVVLALVLQLAQGAGAALGWGFQLQSPFVTAGLALVMLLVALNMSGFFESVRRCKASARARSTGTVAGLGLHDRRAGGGGGRAPAPRPSWPPPSAWPWPRAA
ncbi:MAG: hypothetical protein WDN06_05035 [Asticcacaulis sp.]